MNYVHSIPPLQQPLTMEDNCDPLARPSNSTVSGEPFDERTVNAVWEKAAKEFGFFFYRKDCCLAIIAKHEFGKKSRYGWEIDHIIPVSKGGTDDIDNLQPLHWENNASKGNDFPEWTCKRKI